MKKYFSKLLIGILIFSNSFTTFGQSSVIKYSNNYYSAGVKTQTFNYIASIGKQRADNWCWAACTQMVLNYHGLNVTQEQIVKKCFGGLYDAPGGTMEMFTALNGWAYNTRGGASNIYTNNYPTNANEIQSLLANNWPLIVGLNFGTDVGHAYVLTAIYYSLSHDAYGRVIVIPDKVVLRDPWPNSKSRQEMSWAKFSTNVVSIYKVWVKDIPTYNNIYSWFQPRERTKVEDKNLYKWGVYTGLSFTETGIGLPLPIYVERSFFERELALRGHLHWRVKQTGQEISTKYFGLGLDVDKLFFRPYKWDWSIGLFSYYRSLKLTSNFLEYDYSTFPNTATLVENIDNYSHIFLGARFGGDYQIFPKLYFSMDLGLGYKVYFEQNNRFGSDLNLLIGYRF